MPTQTITAHIRDHLLRDLEPPRILPYPLVVASQWSNEFERYMRNRMAMGAYRYGLIRDDSAPKWDNVGSLIARALAYLDDGNQEHLVDAANLALIEFVRGNCHPGPHFSSIDDGYHTDELNSVG
jgi:hypothetical protein